MSDLILDSLDFSMYCTFWSAKPMIKPLTSFTNLGTLSIGFAHLGESDARSLGRAFKENRSLSTLSLGYFQSPAFEAILSGLQNHPTLKNLTFVTSDRSGLPGIPQFLANNTTLERFDIEWGITDDVVKDIAKALEVNTTLLWLYFRFPLVDACCMALANALLVNETLQVIEIPIHKMSLATAQQFGTVLRNNKALQSLILVYFPQEGIKYLASGLMKNQTLTSLKLNSGTIGDDGASFIAGFLFENKTLTSLNIMGGDIGTAGIKALAGALMVNTTLIDVGLDYNEITDEGMGYLADALVVNETVQTLGLIGVSKFSVLTIEGIKTLAAALQQNKGLISLNFSGYGCGDASACCLLAGLQGNKTMQRLILERNALTSAFADQVKDILPILSLKELDVAENNLSSGAEALLTILPPTLESLNLMFNNIKTIDFTPLLTPGGSYLITLSLYGNDLDASVAKTLGDVLAYPNGLVDLDIAYNSIGDEGIGYISEGLKSNTTLRVLNLTYTRMTHVGLESLSDALVYNSTLRLLNINANQVGVSGTNALAAALQTNKGLKELNIDGI